MKDTATKSVAIAAVIASMALGGAAFANAASSSSAATVAPSTAATLAPADSTGTPGRDGGFGGQRPDETVVTGDIASKLTAAATAKLGSGATIEKVETDADGAAYEAHATKADGSRVTVLFDKDAKVTSVEEGMGPGGAANAPAPAA